ncbi:MAG: methyltransferase domain-containing protein [Candidatus Roizmanbacteria bacterium]|nr:methyltransferase domain-containing protein [Candidatus Roizmanbacteria bacterium]
MVYIYVVLLAVLCMVMIFVFKKIVIEIFPALHFGAIYVPSSDTKMKIMMKYAAVKPGDRVIDLGSGDGRLVIAAAQKGAHAVGVELHAEMINVSRKKIQKLHLEDVAEIRKENMWKTDVSDYDVVFVYGVTYIMNRLEKKLLKELKKGTRVISNNYRFPHWSPVKEKDNVRLYIK